MPDDPVTLPHEHLRETPVSRRVLHEGYMGFLLDTVRDADGRLHERMVVEHPGAVAIVALDGDELILVRQYRHPAGVALLEIPAGTLDRGPDGKVEEPDLAAPRELTEETGLTAATWHKLGRFWTAPGFATELMHLYLASDIAPAADYAGPAPDERLDVVRVDRHEAVELCEGGEIADAKSIVGILWLERLASRGEL